MMILVSEAAKATVCNMVSNPRPSMALPKSAQTTTSLDHLLISALMRYHSRAVSVLLPLVRYLYTPNQSGTTVHRSHTCEIVSVTTALGPLDGIGAAAHTRTRTDEACRPLIFPFLETEPCRPLILFFGNRAVSATHFFSVDLSFCFLGTEPCRPLIFFVWARANTS